MYINLNSPAKKKKPKKIIL